MTKKQKIKNSKNAITSMYFNLKEIIIGVKYRSKKSAGLASMLLKMLHQITITRYAGLEQIKDKSFIACVYDRASQKNPNPMLIPRHKNGNSTWRLSLNLMICMPEHGSQILGNKLGFDNDLDGPSPHNPRELAIASDHTDAETCSTQGTPRKSSPEGFLPKDGSSDKTDTYLYL